MAEQVLPHVVTLSNALGLRVVLLRVSLPTEDIYHAMGFQVAPYSDVSKEADAQAQNYFDDFSEKLRNLGTAQVETEVLDGHPAEAILTFAEKTPDSLLAMTTHGRSRVSRLVMGSIADRVVRSIGGPLLLVRAAE